MRHPVKERSKGLPRRTADIAARGGDLRFHHRRAGVVFRGDQFNVCFLTLIFFLNRRPQVGIGLGEGVLAVEHGKQAGLERARF